MSRRFRSEAKMFAENMHDDHLQILDGLGSSHEGFSEDALLTESIS